MLKSWKAEMTQLKIEEIYDKKEKIEKIIIIREHLPDSHIPEDIIEENGKVKHQIIIC